MESMSVQNLSHAKQMDEIDVKAVSRALAEDRDRRQIMSRKKMDLVKTVQSLEKANLKETQEVLLDSNGKDKSYLLHMPRKDSNRSFFDDEEDFMGGMSISNFSK